MKMTRRQLTVALAASAQAAPQTKPSDQELAAAKEQLRRHAETLAKFKLPMATEPAFHFKA